MSRTFDTQTIIDRHLELDGITLPSRMGIGALRHLAAKATRTHWDAIKTGGIYDTIEKYRTDFLGDACDPDDLLDANDAAELPVDAQDMLREYLRAWSATGYGHRPGAAGMEPPTPDYIDALMADLLVDSLAGWVAQHVRFAIEEATGVDVESSGKDVPTLDGWDVK